MSEIKACPYCGAEAKKAEKVHNSTFGVPIPYYFIYCTKCGARGPSWSDKKEVVTIWNNVAKWGKNG